jgi:hypothetical protein
MKNFLLSLLCGLVFVSCSSEPENEVGKLINSGSEESPFYHMTIETSDGVDSLVKVDFYIPEQIVDSLNISEDVIRKICEESLSYGDWDVKNKRTYRFKENVNSISYYKEDATILAWVYGIASNGFGVEGDINTMIEFDTTGVMRRDEYDIPIITSREY